MEKREAIPLTGLVMCYLGPLVLLLLPGYSGESTLMRRCVREGLLLFFVSFAGLLVIRMLSSVPIFGVLFQALLILSWMVYLISIGWMIAKKHADPYAQIPFLTAYADRLEWN